METLTNPPINLSRRNFLIKSGWVAAGITILMNTGCSLIPAIPTTSDDIEEGINGWVQITPENRIRYFMGKAEMGQGVLNGISQILAAEFNMTLSEVDPVFPHTNQIDPVRMTVGSESISTLYPHLRKASAQLKESLQEALLKKVGGDSNDLSEKEGGVLHTPTQQFYSYGAIVQQSPKIKILKSTPSLKPPRQQPLIGKRQFFLDTPAKVQGKAIYTHDVQLPRMLYGKVAKPPVFEATMQSVDSQLAKNIPGVVKVVLDLDDNFVGVIAQSDLAAAEALKKIKIQWNIPKVWQQGDVDHELDINFLNAEGINPDILKEEGDVEDAQEVAQHHLKRDYYTPFGAHAAMETHAGVAHVTQNKADIWVGSQDAFFHQKLAAKITGLSEDKVNVHTTFIGGGFGGKVMVGAAVEAIRLSNAVKQPVRVIWDREENFQYGYFRPPSQHQIKAGVTKTGKVAYWQHQFSSGAVIFSTGMLPRSLHKLILTFTTDFGASRGALIPYTFANQQIEQWDRIFPIPTGAWRGLSSSTNAFAIESTIDDLAHLAKVDPLQFRLNHLNDTQSRLKAVVKKVGELANWKQPLPSGWGRGIACGIYKEMSYVAVVADAEVDAQTQSIQVKKLYCAHDCGLIINPNSVETMIEGNLVWGISMTLKENLSVKNGQMNASNFNTYSVARMSDVPPIEIALIEDKSIPPSGAGEPAIMVTPAAIANAVFDATGKRPSRLPIRWEDLFETV